MFGLIRTVGLLFVAGAMGAPTLISRQTSTVGSIELVHNSASHSYNMLVTLDPTNYTNTYGRTELIVADTDLFASLKFYVTATTPSNGNTTYYTIHSDVVSVSDPAPTLAPLSNITMLNVAPQYFPDKQLYLFSIDVNGQPAMSGSYNWNTEVLQGLAFNASLTENLNVTGLVRAVSGNINVIS